MKVIVILSLITLTLAATRPWYNTGTGFFVVGNKVYDANGVQFNMKGVNHLHWDFPASGIPNANPNVERWVIDFNQPTSTNQGLIQGTIDSHIVPIPGNWDGTCNEDPVVLSQITNTWIAQKSMWQQFERYTIYNIANEWGPANSTIWRDSYIQSITKMRQAGYTGALLITSGKCGQDIGNIVTYGNDLLNADPQKNLIFGVHIYGLWCIDNCQSWQTNLYHGMQDLANTGLAIIVGEFGPGNNVGPSPTTITPQQIINESNKHGFGWIAWAWDDPPYGGTDDTFAMSVNGNFNSNADLTTFGKIVVVDGTIGLLSTAVPATVF